MLVMVHFKHLELDCIVRISSKLFSCGSIFSCFIFVALFSWLKFKLHASFEPVMYSRINISVLVQAAFHFSEIHLIARFRRYKQIKLLKKEIVQFPLFSVRNLARKENFETLKKACDFHCLSVIVVKKLNLMFYWYVFLIDVLVELEEALKVSSEIPFYK